MSRENYLAAANELGLADDPLIRDVMNLLYASDKAYHAQVSEQIALCERVGAQLDSVRGLVPVIEELPR
ncbi:hypothetical protein LF41_2384 [Lysobacter dokdonensis DS-58]|uniref:Uncharacterized protein n=1 Tax=Lysobacter dokdonensis DS-58 TaxID=1300345 RepID=A0A0A2WMB1_9GAMM|nr:hypothetical protein [Lysobacter dokdonensis]KGQ19877.1 hypothetical protein LF41_2384 [Lysobacter dokdonensis DS-58]